MPDVPFWLYVAFTLFLVFMLILDLGVFHRTAHEVSSREAAIWSAIWVGLSALFGVGIWYFAGPDPAVLFATGYLIEKALAIDNVFVIAIIFAAFAVPKAYQHRVLFIGIVSALIMRAALIAAGATLIDQFHWILYVFGAFLLFTGVKMLRSSEHAVDIDKNIFVRLLRRLMPITREYHGQKFLVRRDGVLMATPLLVVLLLVEFTDLVFAVDSIPAIFAITTDPFLVFTSNALAILGLRSMYFLLANARNRFHYLSHALGGILIFVGLKMTFSHWFHVNTYLSLGLILLMLVLAVVFSERKARQLGLTGEAFAKTHDHS